MPLSPLATTPVLATPLTQVEPRAGGVAFAEDESWGQAPAAGDFADSLRNAQESERCDCAPMDDSAAAEEGDSTPDAAIDLDEDLNDRDDAVSVEPAADSIVQQQPESEHTECHPIVQESAPSESHLAESAPSDPGSSNATVGSKPSSVNPAPVLVAPPILTDATAAQPVSVPPLVQNADQPVAPLAATAAAPAVANTPQVRETGRSQPRPPIDAESSSTAIGKGDADRPDDAAQSALRLRAGRAAVDRPAGSEQPTNERQPTTAESPKPAPSQSQSAARDGDVEPAADALEANPVAGAKHRATREARSLQLNIAAAVDAPRGGDAPATPATSRAAQLDQAIRLENALASGTPTGDAATTKPSMAVSVLHAPSIGAGAGEAALLSGRTVVADEADVPASFSSQAIRGLTAMVNQRGGSMMLRLDPPELGMLRVQMTIVGGNVTAEFTAAAQQTQTLLDRSMAALRQSLEHQGLTVERLTVHPATATSHSGQSSMRHDDGGGAGPNQQQSWANQHDAGGSESRGRREQSPDQSNAWNRLAARATSFESLLGADERLVAAGAGVDS